MDELCYVSATTLARRIRDRELCSEEVVQAHLQRIENINPRLNAVVQLAGEQALEDARAADAALAHGQHLGALHGVPFTVKDWIDAAGLPCTGGYLAFRTRVPTEDATVVARMRQAGAILLGKPTSWSGIRSMGAPTTPTTWPIAPRGAAAAKQH